MAKPTDTKKSKGKNTVPFLSRLRPKLNGYLHRYVRLRGVTWTRYSTAEKLEEEFGELMEALADYEANPSPKKKRHLQEEAADVFFCLTGIGEKLDFDLVDAVELKIQKDRGRNMRKPKAKIKG